MLFITKIIRVDFPEPPRSESLFIIAINVSPSLSCNSYNPDYLIKLTFWHISSATISLRWLKIILFCSNRLFPWVSMETINGPNSFTRHTHSVSGIPRSRHWASSISSTHTAATTAQPAGNTQCSVLCSAQPSSVPFPIPPLPTINFTPVWAINSFSNFSMRMLVVGPTETISNLSSSPLIGRTIGPACKIAPPRTSTGNSRPPSINRRCATSRQVTI